MEGDNPSPRGYNSKRVKYTKILKKNLLLQNQQAKINQTGTNYPLVKRIQVCSIKRSGPLQTGDHHRNVKKGGVI
jgi:hypothetical protein